MSRIVCFNHFDIFPPRVGGAIRILEILRNMMHFGHNVTLYTYGIERRYKRYGITFNTISNPFSQFPLLFKNLIGEEGRSAFNALLSMYPKLTRVAKRDVFHANIVQTEHLWASLFPLILAKKLGKIAIFDDHNVEYALVEKAFHFLSTRNKFLWNPWRYTVKFLENTCCRLADLIFVTSNIDRALLHKIHKIPLKKIVVIENGVNTEEIYPLKTEGKLIRREYGLKNDTVLLFIGKYTYPSNSLAAEYIVKEMAPKIFDLFPNVKILMVGRDPPKYLHGNPKIIWTGEVKDIRPYINASDVTLAPIPLASGTRLKILSYLACEKPVVSTPEGAKGLELTDGRDILIRNLDDFTRAVIDLIENPSYRSDLSHGKWKLMRLKYDWRKISKKVNEAYNRLL